MQDAMDFDTGGGAGSFRSAGSLGHAPGSTVGVLGDGPIARALGAGFLSRGWRLMLGTSSPGAVSAWQASVAGEPDVGPYADAARYGDVVVLAVDPGRALDVVESMGASPFEDVLVVHVLPARDSIAVDAVARGDADRSLPERVQERLPDAQVVACLAPVEPTQLVDPPEYAETPRPLVCGDDARAKDATARIFVDFGWPGVRDVGALDAAREFRALLDDAPGESVE